MVARSSLLRRPTPGAHPARRTSSVVAALAALAPRLVRLAHHDYSDRLLERTYPYERAGNAGGPRRRLDGAAPGRAAGLGNARSARARVPRRARRRLPHGALDLARGRPRPLGPRTL